MWIDICDYCCCKKNEYKFVYSCVQNNNIYQGNLITDDKQNIGNIAKGQLNRNLYKKQIFYLLVQNVIGMKILL